jgi:hypothetical protein
VRIYHIHLDKKSDPMGITQRSAMSHRTPLFSKIN